MFWLIKKGQEPPHHWHCTSNSTMDADSPHNASLPGGFPFFGRFPFEVRLMVWEEACHVERIIPLLPGVGHLFPALHPHLAIPPLLHACSESRRVALQHYDLSFYPKIYTSRLYDHLMLHVFYPHQIIDFSLFFKRETGFNWAASPPRLAVLLDDIAFHQSTEDQRKTAWRTDPTWRQRLLPFSTDFIWSLGNRHRVLEQLTLLVVPPLTARPNCTAQRFEFVDGVPDLKVICDGLEPHFRERAQTSYSWPEGAEKRLPGFRVRHAVCSPWEASNASSWAASIRVRYSVEEYADLDFGAPPPGSERLPDNVFGLGLRGPWGTGPRCERITGIPRDLKRLRKPYCETVGLGPHVLWDSMRYLCVMSHSAHHEGLKHVLWLEDYKLPLPLLPSWSRNSDPLNLEIDFDAFLKESEERAKEEEDEDPSREMKSLNCNGLLFWD